jgi:hypothetical protein
VPRPSTASGPALIGADLDTPFLTRGLAAGTRLTGLGDQLDGARAIGEAGVLVLAPDRFGPYLYLAP